jgi:hypothetical protein
MWVDSLRVELLDPGGALAVARVLGGFIATRPLRCSAAPSYRGRIRCHPRNTPRGAKPQNVAVPHAFMVKGLPRRGPRTRLFIGTASISIPRYLFFARLLIVSTSPADVFERIGHSRRRHDDPRPLSQCLKHHQYDRQACALSESDPPVGCRHSQLGSTERYAMISPPKSNITLP